MVLDGGYGILKRRMAEQGSFGGDAFIYVSSVYKISFWNQMFVTGSSENQ